MNDSGYLIENNNKSWSSLSPSDFQLMQTGQIPPISSMMVENIHYLAEVVNDTKAAAAEAELTQHIEAVSSVSISSLAHGPQAEPDTMLLLMAEENALLLPQCEEN